MSRSEIDDLNARLLATMRAHPRVGLTELARLLHVARGTVQARLDKLVARGVIADFGPTVRPDQIGFPVLQFSLLQIAQGHATDAVRHLETLPEVLEVHGTSGTSDLLCRVAARTNEHLQGIIADVLASPAFQLSDMMGRAVDWIPSASSPSCGRHRASGGHELREHEPGPNAAPRPRQLALNGAERPVYGLGSYSVRRSPGSSMRASRSAGSA